MSCSSVVKSAQALEMSVGKVPFLEAVNGSTVTLPCTYSSCIGIENLYFRWQFNDNGTMQTVNPSTRHDGVVFALVWGLFWDGWQRFPFAVRCVTQWYRQRQWCQRWRCIKSGSNLWGWTGKTTFPSCCGTSPLRMEASTLVLGATPKKRRRTIAPSSNSLWWTSVSVPHFPGNEGRGLGWSSPVWIRHCTTHTYCTLCKYFIFFNKRYSSIFTLFCSAA